jgi:hypothetical protein
VLDLGALPGGVGGSTANGINSSGVVVGSSGGRAFVWTESEGMLDLNDLLDGMSGAGWTLQYAADINDSGWIAGAGLYDPDGPGGAEAVTRAFLLRPVPEPRALLVIAMATALVACLRRR